MKIVVINPNTTVSMTEEIAQAAQAAACKDTEILTCTAPFGPPGIDGHVDEAYSSLGVVQVVRQYRESGAEPDAYVIACYGDPGIHAAREMTERPVVGIAQASMYLAAMVAHKFSIITLTARTIAPLEALIQAYGMQQSVASIRATAMSVLDYVRDPVAGMKALAEQSRLAIEQDGAEAVCLGCAGMVSFTQQLEQELQVPVFDGVIAAVKIAEGLAFLGKKTSKICSYAWPSPDSLKGFEPSTEGGYLIR